MNNGNFKLPFREKVGYGFGDAASSMFWKIFTFYLPIFYTDTFEISAAAAGTMFLITRIWDTANDPIMGIICDRTKSRWGKFRPYLLWMAIPFGLMGILLFTTPDFSATGKLVYAYITYTFMMMVYTSINVPYASLLGVMSSNSGHRTTFASYRMIFAFGGSLLVVAIYQPLLDFFNISVSVKTSYQLTMAVISIIAIIFFMFTFLWTKERIVPQKSKQNKLKDDIKDLLKNVHWFILLGASVTTLIFNSVRDGVSLYYFKYYIIDSTALNIFNFQISFSTVYIFLGQVTPIIAIALAMPISGILGKRRTFLFAMISASVLSGLFYFCSKEYLIFIYILQALISFCAGIIFPLVWSMYADASDYSEWKTGRRATGLVFSASSMSQKLGWTIGGSVTLWLLAVYGFKANVEQSQLTIKGIKYMMSIIPGIAALLSGLFIYFYKLNDKYMNSIMDELKIKREKEN